MKYYSIVPNYHMAIRLVLNHFDKMGYERVAYAGAVYTLRTGENAYRWIEILLL